MDQRSFPSDIPAETPERAALLENVRAIVPEIRACADAIEENRRIPDHIIGRLAEAGVFRMSVAREHGGLEVDPLTNFAVIEELAKADASVAWCCMISSAVAWGVSSVLGEDLARELFLRDPLMILAGFNAPSGIAMAVEGGYRLTGRWPFGSGIRHAKYMVVSSAVSDETGFRKDPSGATQLATLLVPTASLEIIETWKTTGMRGTGSHDYCATDLFVPASHVVPLWDGKRRESPAYRYPAFYLLNMAAVPLGVGASAIASMREGKGPFRADRLMFAAADDTMRNVWLAEAVGLVGAARAFIVEVARDTWRAVASGRELTLTERATFRLALSHAFQASSDAVQKVYDAYGSSSFYATNPVERYMRDLQTMKQHGAVSPRSFNRPGQMLLGHDPKHILW